MEEEMAKWSREGDDNNGSDEAANGVSAIIPGWFSEMSPMWPG